jgi:chromosomal replication initiator protein
MSATERLDWNALLQAVRTDHPALYRAWFELLEPGQLAGGELRVTARDPAWMHYLREHCTQLFSDAAMELTGHLVSVCFTSGSEDPLNDTALARDEVQHLSLNPDYTFEEFVVGSTNRLAHAASQAVCNQPGALYNPLFIHGASGLGKSHLLQAICSELLRSIASVNVLYVACDNFVSDYVRAIETGELQAFRDCFRRVDALLIDDIQFLANRESSQEELFHTFNTLYQERRQIVLSADSAPSEIPNLEDRLVSRFNWGLVAQIDPPTRETRQAILQKKARLRGYEIPAEVIDYIAEHVDSNIRALEGALTKLITENQHCGKPLTLTTARKVLPARPAVVAKPLQVSDVLQVVSQHFGIRLQDLLGRRRTRSVSYPRNIAIFLARKMTMLSLGEIGMHFDGRDHSTVLHAQRVIDAERQRNPQTQETLNVLTKQLLARS